MSYEFFIAFRYLRSRRKDGFISATALFSFLGIMLGVATLIIVMSVMNGFRAELIDRILGINGHINILQTRGDLTDYDDVIARIQSHKDIEIIFPVIEKQALLSTQKNNKGVVVRGIRADDFLSKPLFRDSIVAGEIEDFAILKIGIGEVQAKRLGLSIGDKITLLSPQAKATPFGSVPTSARFEIAFLFDVGMHEYNANFVFMPLGTAQKFFKMGDAVSSIEIMGRDAQALSKIKIPLKQDLGYGYRIVDWQQTNSSFFNALKVERNVMFLILTLIIIVAAFNIISSMIMLVKDKGRDIAILRSMGASRRSITKIFMIAGAFIGVLGTCLGAILGISFAINIESIRQWLEGFTGTDLFAAEIYFLSQLPAIVKWEEVTLIVSMAFGLSVLATLYPALRAARLDPLEGIRYE